jgi:hypothetical protein
LYLWGNISDYVVSYYHFKGDKDATLRSAVVCLPISFTMQSLANPIGSYLQKHVNPQIILASGSAIMIGSIFAASLMQTWWGFVAWWCLGFPIGIGLVFYTPI